MRSLPLLLLLTAAGCGSATVGVTDANDTGTRAPAPDAAARDAGVAGDAASSDLGAPDAVLDTGPSLDAEAADAEAADAEAADAEPVDAGTQGGALRFDGVDDRVAIRGEPGGFRRNAFSEETWFRTRTSTGAMLEVHSTTARLGADRALFLSAGRACFYVYSPMRSSRCSTARYDDGAWHHIAGTIGPEGQTLYVDGVVVSRTASVTRSAFDWDTELQLGYGHIGADTTLVHFEGELDEVRLWRITRTATDVRADYRRAIDPMSLGLIGYWRMDETGTATAARDLSPARRDGRLEAFGGQPSPWVSGGAF
jgi:hypothetical protein